MEEGVVGDNDDGSREVDFTGLKWGRVLFFYSMAV